MSKEHKKDKTSITLSIGGVLKGLWGTASHAQLFPEAGSSIAIEERMISFHLVSSTALHLTARRLLCIDWTLSALV